MKHKIFGALTLASALLITSSFNVSHNTGNIENVGPAPINEFSDDYKGELIARRQADESAIIIPKKIIIHYQLDDGNYANKRFWLWGGDYDPKKEFEATGIDDYGMYIEIDPSVAGEHEEFGFLIFETGNLDASKTNDCMLNYKMYPPDANGLLEVWTYRETDNSIAVFRTIEETMGGKILNAKFKDWKSIHVEVSDVPVKYRLYCFTNEYYSYTSNGRRYHKERFLVDEHKFDSNMTELEFDIPFMSYTPASVSFALEVDFKDLNAVEPNEDGTLKTKTKMKYVGMSSLYKTKRFNEFYTYDGSDLGATYTKEKTSFKLWAPMCARVLLKVYDGGIPSQDKTFDKYKMSLTPGGVWSCEVDGDLNGKYYTYEVSNFAGEDEVVDPYAKAAGIDGARGMILDFDTTDPEGWDKIPDVWDKQGEFDLKAPNDLTVYETHIRDLTMHETWTGKNKAGTYKAFIEKGTTYTENNVTVKTGFDHIEELGVNAVQILPFFDSSNKEKDTILSDKKIDTPYNWGYNPLNYNVVEGAYSEDPYDGKLRVTEVKEMVQAFANNKNHTRVIMDVVYNHVASVATSNFTKIMPFYYFRTNSDGAYMNASGCGNDVRTEAKMMRKFIVESVKWWATEYKIKGFRFDLMGLIDVETMRQVKDELYKIDPDIVCYGEGWPWPNQDGYPNNGTFTDNIYSKLYPSKDSPGILGGFSDTFRNAIRGGNGWGEEKTPEYGFIAQGSNDVYDKSAIIAEGIRGMNKGKGGNPYQTVNYASCHDNYALYDQLHYTLGDATHTIEPTFEALTESIIAVQSAVAFSNGIAFFNGGEELLHSKVDPEGSKVETTPMYGQIISHNSYKSSDATNAYDYSNKISLNYGGEDHDTQSFFAKYKEMIAQRAVFESRHGYSDGMPNTGQWYANADEHNANGALGLGVYWKYNNTEYWMLMSGKEPVEIGFDSYDRTTCIYNSLDGENTFTMNGKRIKLSARQFIVFKAN